MEKENQEYVIRNLTSLEDFLLMGFEKEDYIKVKKLNSSTQLVKQAGNSIGVTCLVAIFSMLYSDIYYEKVINDYVEDILSKKEKIS